jgi:hypothetical protein
MTGSNIDHMDVGAYALGVLSDWEATQFEMHLAGCATCAHELEELTLVSNLLSHVDGNSIAVVEDYGRDGRAFDRMLNVVSMERRRAHTRRVLSMAAAFVLVAAGIAYGLVGTSPFTGGPSGTPRALPSLSKNDVVPGQSTNTVDRTDGKTGAWARVTLMPANWGTSVALMLTKVDGPLDCQLVAVPKSGDPQVVMTWSVPDKGYGNAQQPEPLNISGATALKKSDIDHFEVRATGSKATKTPLVTLPVPS